MREELACLGCQYEGVCDSPPTLGGKPKSEECRYRLQVADRTISLLKPQMLTVDEARELLHCWKNESASRYGKVNRQAPLYLKLKGMVEGQ